MLEQIARNLLLKFPLFFKYYYESQYFHLFGYLMAIINIILRSPSNFKLLYLYIFIHIFMNYVIITSFTR